MWLPIFLSGIYYLGRRGAVGQSEQLIIQGIYRYVRNPMYSGLSLTILGVGLLLNSTGVALTGLLWLAMTFVQCKREEKELTERFGSAYVEYKNTTPMFLPDFVKWFKEQRR
ncbi:MAG: isoprenylcysteine carboxylmethyltransferase family protein [Candidatus Atribacteria bacterium]|nr:isoprenylcysteine carboxylmethyltransferase family protein [Candidatus Atribacteria bacterium]